MKLVQKLPLGLALAACMMLSSCSQEDVQVAQPEKVANGFSNERGGGLQSLPTIPKTDGAAGINTVVADWIFSLIGGSSVEAGTSTKTHLWGDPNFPWTKPFLNPPGATIGSANNFVTVMAQKNFLANNTNTHSFALAKIKHLIPGKKYALTVSFASSVCIKNGEPTIYSPGAYALVPGTINPDIANGTTLVDLKGKQAEWVTKTITFVAQGTEATAHFGEYVALDPQFVFTHDKYLSYVHAFVGANAIVEVP